jgi:hypothetical protein
MSRFLIFTALFTAGVLISVSQAQDASTSYVGYEFTYGGQNYKFSASTSENDPFCDEFIPTNTLTSIFTNATKRGTGNPSMPNNANQPQQDGGLSHRVLPNAGSTVQLGSAAALQLSWTLIVVVSSMCYLLM